MGTKTHAVWDSRFLNQVFDSMAEGVFTLDERGRISSWNPAMEHISGYGAEEVLGKPCAFLNFNRYFGKICPTNTYECVIFKQGRNDVTECFLRHKIGRNVCLMKKSKIIIILLTPLRL